MKAEGPQAKGPQASAAPALLIDRVRALRGPNLWSKHTAIQALVTVGAEHRSIEDCEALVRRLCERFPALAGRNLMAFGERCSLPDLLQQVALELQAQAGCPVSFGRAAPTTDAGVWQVVFEYTQEAVGRRALQVAEDLLNAALADAPFETKPFVDEMHELDEDIRLGPSTGSITNAAIARGIPITRLTDGSLVQLGWGRRQRRIQAAEADATSAIAESLAQDKDLTKKLLHAAGVPVPEGRPVSDVDDAWRAMQHLGGRIVVKPQDGNQGKGVTVNVTTREQLEAAFVAAEEFGSDVMVERFIPGHDFRLLVVGNKLVAAARRDPPFVIGDGKSTVRELVDKVNQDPRRGSGHATSLTKIRLDAIALDRLKLQDMTPDFVPAQGVRVVLRNNANLSTGGSATDVTDEVHPDMAARAVEAAQTVGLHICGVDVVCRTVFAPLEQQAGGIVEVNAAPGLRMHLTPSAGKGRNVGEAVISSMFEPGNDGRIPVVAITGTNGKTTTTRLIARMLEANRMTVGMTLTDGVWVGGRQIDDGDCSGPKSARSVLAHPDADAAVFETARGGILREGLAYDRCDVAVVTNIGVGDHLGMNYITTVEELAVLKRVIVQNVGPKGYAVLNAADPLTAAMADTCPGKVIFFARDRNLPVMQQHLASGGRIVCVEEAGVIACHEGAHPGPVHRLDLSTVPLTMGGRIPFQVENVMAAVGACWGLDLPWPVIDAGAQRFSSDVSTTPGRFNVLDYKGATVIADYGHNPDAIAALVQAIEVMPAKRRSVVISGAGDRRDEDITRQTEILGDAFDEVVLYQDAAQRGRADGEVIALLRKGLGQAKRAKQVQEVHGEFKAIDSALSRLKEGDLCLILVDQVGEALQHLKDSGAV